MRSEDRTNMPGRVDARDKLKYEVAREAGIDLIAMSIADTEQYGILRCIVANPDACVRALRDAGYTLLN